jgi:hypothetical protein
MSEATHPSSRSDQELVTLARSILEREGFVVEQSAGESDGILLSEDPYFIVAIVTASTVDQLVEAESLGEMTLIERLNEHDLGPKVWDAYLVLLTQQAALEDAETTRKLFEINYDTANLRRIVVTDVRPTASAVEAALAPFIAPPSKADQTVVESPFVQLTRSLAGLGVDPGLAERAVTAFEQGANLVDAL